MLTVERKFELYTPRAENSDGIFFLAEMEGCLDGCTSSLVGVERHFSHPT